MTDNTGADPHHRSTSADLRHLPSVICHLTSDICPLSSALCPLSSDLRYLSIATPSFHSKIRNPKSKILYSVLCPLSSDLRYLSIATPSFHSKIRNPKSKILYSVLCPLSSDLRPPTSDIGQTGMPNIRPQLQKWLASNRVPDLIEAKYWWAMRA